MAQSALIFLHISKTGGTTLRSIIAAQYAPEHIFDLDPSYFTSDPSEYDVVFQDRVKALLALPDSDKSAYRCFFHPTAYGLHKHLPQPVRYVTMLRDPIDHYISSYYFAINRPKHRLHKAITENNIPLEDMPDAFPDDELLDNLQTRRLSGCDTVDTFRDVVKPLPPDALDKAKQNLKEGIEVIGLMDRYDESLLLMQATLGWKNVHYTRKNVAPRRRAVDSISPNLRQRLENDLALDYELYTYATTLFEEQITRSALDMSAALAAFEKQNAQNQQWVSTRKQVRKTLTAFKRRFTSSK